MPTTCQFKFARSTPIYYSGEQIIGTITLNTTKLLTVEGLELTLLGTTRVEWLERCKRPWLLHNDSSETNNHILHSDKRTQLQQTLPLRATRLTLHPGSAHVEHFCFDLPDTTELPATCELEYGEVVYSLNLTLQRKYVFSKVFKARVIVKSRMDLSDAMELTQSHTLSSNVFSNVSSPPLQFTLPTTGFVPGQQLAYELRNLDAVKDSMCSNVQLQLYQRITYRCLELNHQLQSLSQSESHSQPQSQPCKHVHKLLAKETLKIAAQMAVINGELHIPLLTPISTAPTLESQLIQISYYVQAVLSGRKRILERLCIPITIGTVAPRSRAASVADSVDTDAEHSFCYDNLATALHDDDNVEDINDYDYESRSSIASCNLSTAAADANNDVYSRLQPLARQQQHTRVLQQHVANDGIICPATFLRAWTYLDRTNLLHVEC